MLKFPTFENEIEIWNKGKVAIGVDEVGRGALCGPITVAAVCLKPCLLEADSSKWIDLKINDSKKLTPHERERLSAIIREKSLAYSIVSVGSAYINRYGIVPATQRSVRMAVQEVMEKIKYEAHCLLDAFYIPRLRKFPRPKQTAIIKGDELSISIAAASIIAKVERDAYMRQLSSKYPKYNWYENKGYGTKDHIEALKLLGPTKYHRTLFLRRII